MNDTPQTDAMRLTDDLMLVPADFARTLERDLAAARLRIAELEAERDAWRAGLDAKTGSSPGVEITPEIPQSFFAGLAETREIQLAERDRQLKQARARIAELEAERDRLRQLLEDTLPTMDDALQDVRENLTTRGPQWQSAVTAYEEQIAEIRSAIEEQKP